MPVEAKQHPFTVTLADGTVAGGAQTEADAVVLAAGAFAHSGLQMNVSDGVGTLVAQIGLDTATEEAPAVGPQITDLEPATGDPLVPPQVLVVIGSGFVDGAEILWDEGPVATTFESETELRARLDLLDAEIESGTSVYVQVRNPGGQASNIVVFSWETPAP